MIWSQPPFSGFFSFRYRRRKYSSLTEVPFLFSIWGTHPTFQSVSKPSLDIKTSKGDILWEVLSPIFPGDVTRAGALPFNLSGHGAYILCPPAQG